MYYNAEKIVNYSKPLQQERRLYPREMLTADDKRTWYKKYVTASGIYFRNYYYLRELSMTSIRN